MKLIPFLASLGLWAFFSGLRTKKGGQKDPLYHVISMFHQLSENINAILYLLTPNL